MSTPRNIAASVRQRLLNLARSERADFQLVLNRYGLERLLFRLSQSRHHDRFVLKGAMPFQLGSGHPHRPTRDLDLLGYGEPSIPGFEQLFREICRQDATTDGLTFPSESVRAAQIKEDDEYQGLRIRLEARLGNARIPLQIDIGFGDAVTPAPHMATFPTLLDFPAPTLQTYPRETVIAEKFQAMVVLGIANSRMKDFYDLWTLANQFAFRGSTLCTAIQATFERRRTPLPAAVPLALRTEFTEDSTKQTQWRAFLRKSQLTTGDLALAAVADTLTQFLMPPVEALVRNVEFVRDWLPPGPWQGHQAATRQ